MSEVLRKKGRFKSKKMESAMAPVTAASRLAMSGGVVGCLLYLLLVPASLLSVQTSFAQSVPPAAGVLLQAGIEKEDVDGDLKSAMAIYEKIAADTSAPRDVRARALLRLAGCDEKLGHQAKQVYEQILRDYADQPAAANARKRLAAIHQQEHPALPPTMTSRKIEYPKTWSVGVTDTDGERAVYWEWESDNLYFGDLAGHSKHLILNAKHFGWIPCRDFSLVLLDLLAIPDRPHILAVVRTDGTGYRELIRDDDKNSIFGWNQSFAMSCSWDDRNILLSDFSVKTTLHGQLWIVSVADGSRRILADLGDVRVRKAVFSPDGAFVAFEVQPTEIQSSSTSRVFVVPVSGGEPRLVYESVPWKADNGFLALLDWTADGKFLTIRDYLHGRSALYLLAIKDGLANGDPAFVRFGDFDEGYTTASGALVYEEISTKFANMDVSIAPMGKDGLPGAWRKLEVTMNRYGNPDPSFSADGSQLAYIALIGDPPIKTLLVRDLSTGREREIYTSPEPWISCQFSAIHPKVFCAIQKDKDTTDLISVAVESGAVEHIATFPGSRYIFQPTLDDETFYFSENVWRYTPNTPILVRWNRATQQETVLEPASKVQASERPSLDGRWLLRTQNRTVSIRSVAGADWKPLTSGDIAPYQPFVTPDGKWVWYQAGDSAHRPGLYRVPISGGSPERLGDLPNYNSGGDFFFSPDGRQVLAVSSSYEQFDLWVLDNFVPTAKK